MAGSEDEGFARYRITGAVQGVGFRWWARRTALELGLRGTVRNCPDGTVEVRAAGPPEALDRLREQLAAGPPAASVSRVQELPPTGDPLPPGFRILP